MLLLIDAGNTRIKWALVEEGAALGQWAASGAVGHAELNHLPASWQQHTITRAIVANVAGSKLRDQLQLMIPAKQVDWFASRAELDGMRNAYRKPAQLGCDRFAAALGARALEPGKRLLVATCGTATTIDALCADSVFLGGMILPGLGLMAASLARNTAQLPQVASASPARPLPAGFADNTDDAILSGCLSAQAGAIERAFGMHGATLCVLSGGAAPFIAPLLGVPYRMADNIVLTGLHSTVHPSPYTDTSTG
jgi:type III pantothenate kinase